MPKIVDHDQRREDLLEATWRVIVRDGFRAATTRAIADEAGYSSGVLAHYFENKDELLVAAHKLVYRRALARIQQGSEETHAVGLSALRIFLLQALPLDETRRIEAIVDLAFMSEALSNSRVREWRAAELRSHREDLLKLISQCRQLGQLDTSATDDELIGRFEVLIDGISYQAVLHPELMPHARQVAIMEAVLADISCVADSVAG